MPGCVSCKLDGTAPLSSRPAPAPRPRIGANPFERGLLRPAKCRMLAGERALGSSKCPPGDIEGVVKVGGAGKRAKANRQAPSGLNAGRCGAK